MMESRPAGQLFDIGYQRYDGPREGRTRARLALLVGGIRQSLGLGRGTRSKILPAFMLIVSIVPAAIFLVIAAIGGDRPLELGDYFPLITTLLLIIAAILVPGMIVPDRTENVISLYLVRPMGILDYLVARWLAFFLVTTLILVSGPLLLLLGYILLSDNAADSFRDDWLDFPRILLASACMSAFITSVPMAVAAFTPRRVYAAAVVIGAVLVLGTAIGLLTEDLGTNESRYTLTEEEATAVETTVAQMFATDPLLFSDPNRVIEVEVTLESGETRVFRGLPEEFEGAVVDGEEVTIVEVIRLLERDTSKWVIFADPTGPMVFVTDLLFEDVQESTYRELVAEHPAAFPVAAYFAWMIIPLALMWWRYRRLAS